MMTIWFYHTKASIEKNPHSITLFSYKALVAEWIPYKSCYLSGQLSVVKFVCHSLNAWQVHTNG